MNVLLLFSRNTPHVFWCRTETACYRIEQYNGKTEALWSTQSEDDSVCDIFPCATMQELSERVSEHGFRAADVCLCLGLLIHLQRTC